MNFPPEVLRDPFPFYAQLRAASPVMREPSTGLWLLLDHATVKRALTDPEAFSSAASPEGSAPAKWLIFTDPPRHTRLRSLISRAFTAATVARLEPRIRQLTAQLLEPALRSGELELLQELSVPLPLMVIAELLGAEAADWPLFRRWSDGILGLASTVSGSEGAAQAVKTFQAVHREIGSYLGALLEERRARTCSPICRRSR